ncbi:uroporphyrinogen-III C-methyltransferase [bacterium]|nr:uroporphyrinogen-III C-methyltransferase [bacterium]
MSDKEKKNIEQVVEEAETSDVAVEDVAGAVDEPEPHVAPVAPPLSAKPEPASRAGSSAIAWFALLLVLALAGAAVWSVMEAQRREAQVLGRVAELEGLASQKDTRLDSSIQALEGRWQTQLDAGISALQGESSSQAQAVEALSAQLVDVRAELARFGANDRESWLLAEAEYLLRLANQRLIMAGDAASAQALLSSADNILRELDDAGLHEVRGAVAADLAAVRAVPQVDVEGIYLRLSALVEQAGKLVIFQLPEQEAQPREDALDSWQGRLQQGYQDALVKLSDYIIIRRRDVPMQALMDPQWEGLVRQNLRMLLEQAQVALLSGNESLYSESLQRAQHWVAEFFESDEAAARAMAREITQLTDLNVAASMPDVSRSLRALDQAVEQRLQQGGGE